MTRERQRIVLFHVCSFEHENFTGLKEPVNEKKLARVSIRYCPF